MCISADHTAPSTFVFREMLIGLTLRNVATEAAELDCSSLGSSNTYEGLTLVRA
jgi:hypothetical protein